MRGVRSVTLMRKKNPGAVRMTQKNPQQYNIKRRLLQSYLRPDLIPTLSSLDVNDFPHGSDAADAATELPVSRLAAGRHQSSVSFLKISACLIPGASVVPAGYINVLPVR